ncbi:hypothetical protein ABPG74_000053 [Tetrahymena malaccensis]
MTEFIENSDDPSSPSFDKASYLANEFFFSMVPCYVFLITAVIRYFRVKDKPIKHHDYVFQDTLVSFQIKMRISQFMAFTYVVSLVLGLVSPPLLFFGAQFGWINFLYIFGIMAWIVSVQLLIFEYVREQNQGLYGHRVFWIFSFCFNVLRLFQSHMALFNIIISVSRSIPNFVLLMYGMYKPFDKASQEFDEETPTFARLFFEKFENNRIISKILWYTIVDRSKQSSIHQHLIEDIEMVDQPNGFAVFEITENEDFEVTQSSIDQERKLFNFLPRRNVTVSLKSEKRIEEGQQKVYYQVITTIDNNPYSIFKRFNEFSQVCTDLCEIYDHKNYPKLDKNFPILVKDNFLDKDREKKRIQAIQNWLNEIFKYPFFMHKILLDFLNVEEKLQNPFIVYFKHVSLMKGNKNPVLEKQKKEQEKQVNQTNTTNQEQGVNYDDHFMYLEKQNRFLRNNSTTLDLINVSKIIKARKDQYNFEISCKNAEKSQYGNTLQYLFEVTFIPKQGQKQRWTISKTFTELRELNDQIQEELQINVTYYSIIQSIMKIKDSTDKQDIKRKVEAVNQYMQSVLKQKSFFCKPLFDFIEFDPQKEIHYNSRMCTPRQTILSSENEAMIAQMQGSSTLSQYQGITDEREPGLKTQYNSGLKGVNLQKEFNLINESDFQRNQQILELRDNSKERFVYGINLNRVIISVQKIMTKQIQSVQFKNETRLVTQYLIHLEEYDSFGVIIKQIKLLKYYNQIKQLDENLKYVYRNVDMNYPPIPYDRTPSNQFIADEMKREFDLYFEGILKLSFVEENSSFEGFFHLKELINVRKVSQSGVITYDFTLNDEN